MLRLWTTAQPGELRDLVAPVRRLFDPPPPVEGETFRRLGGEYPQALVPWPARGEVVVAMGADAVKALQDLDQLPGNLSVNKARGRAWPVKGRPGGHWMATYSPGLADREADAWQRIRWDLLLAMRFLTTGTLKPRVGQYRYVRDFSGTVDLVKREADRTGRRVRVFEDLETLGFWPWYPESWIVSCQFCVVPGTADVMAFPRLGDMPSKAVLRQVEWLENADEVSLGGANLKFDNLWKRVKWRLSSPRSFLLDTLLAGGLLDENRRNSLSNHACVYAPEMAGYDAAMNELDKGRMDLVLADDPDGFLVYSGGDVDAGARCRERVVADLRRDPELCSFYAELLHPAAQAFEEIEAEGMLVDEAMLWAVGERARAEVREAEEEMRRLVPGRLKRKRSGTKASDLLEFTPAVLQELFFDKSVGWGLKPTVYAPKVEEEMRQTGRKPRPGDPPSTSLDDHLKRFLGHPKAGPFLAAMRRRNKAEKVASSYVGERRPDGSYEKGFLEHLRPDGRFHPTFSLYVGSQFEQDEGHDESGTVTGRTSAKNPHSQTLPKRTKPGDRDWAKELRACYPAPPGHLVGEVDVSQGELKWHAMLAQEPTMLRLFREGKDMHAMTASRIAGVSYDEFCSWEQSDPKRWKWLRYTSKPRNFGLLYLQSPAGFQRFAWKGYDLDYALEECEQAHAEFFELYPRLVGHAAHQQQQARELGYVENPFGRVRHLPLARSRDRKARAKAMRQAVNSPTQSSLSDQYLWALAIAHRDHDLLRRGLRVFNFVHDAAQFYFPDSSAGFDLVVEFKAILDGLPYATLCGGWEPELEMTSDFEYGPTLAEMGKGE